MATKKYIQSKADTKIDESSISNKAKEIIRNTYKEFLANNDYQDSELLVDFLTLNDVIIMYQLGLFIIKKDATLIHDELIKIGFSKEEIVGADALRLTKRDEILKEKPITDHKYMDRFPYNVILNIFGSSANYIVLECMNDYKKEIEYTTRVYNALGTLKDERMIRIILMRVINHLTYEEMAKVFGVTRERIRQIEAKGYRILRHPSRAKRILHGILYYEKKAYEDLQATIAKQEEFYKAQIAELTGDDPSEVPNDQRELDQQYVDSRLQLSIQDLDLSVRSYNCLARADIKTVEDIVCMTEQDLMRVRNLGRKSFEEVVNRITDLGLHLADGYTETRITQLKEKYNQPKNIEDVDDVIAVAIFKLREKERIAQADHKARMEEKRLELKVAEASKVDKVAEFRKVAEEKLGKAFPDRIMTKLVREIENLADDERIVSILLRTERYDPRRDGIPEGPFNRFLKNINNPSALRRYDHSRLSSVPFGEVGVDTFTSCGVECKTPPVRILGDSED